DIHGDRAKIHANHLFDAGNDVDDPRASGPYHSAKSKNDRALILLQNLDAAYDRDKNKNDKCKRYSQTKHIRLPPLLTMTDRAISALVDYAFDSRQFHPFHPCRSRRRLQRSTILPERKLFLPDSILF